MLALNIYDEGNKIIYHPNPILNYNVWNDDDFTMYNDDAYKILQWKSSNLYNGGEPKYTDKSITFLDEVYTFRVLDIPKDLENEYNEIISKYYTDKQIREYIADAIKSKLWGDLEYKIAMQIFGGDVNEVIDNVFDIKSLFNLPFKTFYKEAKKLIDSGKYTYEDFDNIVIKHTSKFYYNEKLPTPYVALLAREHVKTPDGAGWKPKLGQMYFLYHEIDNKVNLLLSKRQYGKSVLTSLIGFQHLMLDGDHNILFIVESENKILPVMQYFERGLQAYKKAGIFSINKGDYTIKCNITGNILKFMSAGSRTGLKGYSFKIVMIDEASFISDDVFYEIIPIFNKPGGKFYAVSTVSYKVDNKESDWFYDLAKDIELGLNKILGDKINAQAVTVTINEDEGVSDEEKQMFEMIKKRDFMRYCGDYLCIRPNESKLFNKKYYITPISVEEYKKRNILQIIIGWDPAKKEDKAGLVVGGVIRNEDKDKTELVCLEAKGLTHMDYKYQIEEIKNIVNLYNIRNIPISIAMDTTGIGEVVYGMLKEEVSVPIMKILYTAGNQVNYDNTYQTYRVPKKELVDTMLLLGNEGEIKIPVEHTELLNELETYSQVGNKYEAITGHDDIIEAFMNVVFFYQNETKKHLKLFGEGLYSNKNTQNIFTPPPAYVRERHRKFLY